MIDVPTPTDLENQRIENEEISYKNATSADKITRATRLIERGFLSRAARAITEPTTLVIDLDDIIQELQEKHPLGQPLPFGTTANPRVGPLPTKDDIFLAIMSFSRDSAPGLSG